MVINYYLETGSLNSASTPFDISFHYQKPSCSGAAAPLRISYSGCNLHKIYIPLVCCL